MDDQKRQLDDQKRHAEQELADLRRQAEEDRLDAIAGTGLALGADNASVVRQLMQKGNLGQAEAEAFLKAYLEKQKKTDRI